jgi:signal transduction histidine kinase
MTLDLSRRRAFSHGRPQRPGASRAVLWFAILLALPLAVFGIFAFYLFNADYAVTRTRETAQAARQAAELGDIANAALEAKADRAIDQVAAALSKGGPDLIRNLRVASFVNEVRFLLVHDRDGHVIPIVTGTTDSENDFLQRFGGLLSTLREQMDSAEESVSKVGIWAVGDSQISYLRCERMSAMRDICVVFDEITLDPVLEEALDTASAKLNDRLLILRDPVGRALWSHGPQELSTSTISDLAGSLRGWRMETSTPAVVHYGLLPLIAITVPLIGCWLLLIWYMYRGQQARLMESAFRSEMTAKLSHDLRTPIANLRLYTDLLLRRSGDEAAVSRYGAVMRAEVERLALLADNTIVYGRTAAPGPVRLEDAIPDAVVDATIARYENLFAAAGSQIEVEHGAQQSGLFDRMSFERILINLLDNANKYAPGRIVVSTREAGGLLSLSVRDFGPGLDSAAATKVTTLVQPGGGAKDGFGLGFVVVRELAEANGGTVSVENADPGLRVTASVKIKGSAKEPKCPS